jgi:hypothetical protein
VDENVELDAKWSGSGLTFFPLLRPCIIMELVRRSTIGHWAFLKRFAWKRPAEWGTYWADLLFTAM